MYEAGDILIMPNGEEFRVMYISGNDSIALMNTRTKKIIAAQIKYLKTPKKVVKAKLKIIRS